MTLLPFLGVFVPVIVGLGLLGWLAALWRQGVDEILGLIAAPFRELPGPLRLPAFLAVLWALWAGMQAFAPHTPVVAPVTPVEATAPSPGVFLPFIGR
jgi:hypothetical protein